MTSSRSLIVCTALAVAGLMATAVGCGTTEGDLATDGLDAQLAVADDQLPVATPQPAAPATAPATPDSTRPALPVPGPATGNAQAPTAAEPEGSAPTSAPTTASTATTIAPTTTPTTPTETTPTTAATTTPTIATSSTATSDTSDTTAPSSSSTTQIVTTITTAPPGGGDESVVVFRIAPGTGSGPWNTYEDPVRVRVGQILRVYNDDSVDHTIHANGSPFPHGKRIAPGSFRDHTVVSPSQPSPGSPALYEHSAGRSAAFWVIATN